MRIPVRWALLCTALSLAACASLPTGNPLVQAQRALVAANTAYVATCTGATGDVARACIRADDALDAADRAYRLGDAALTLAKVQAANTSLTEADRLKN